MKDEKQVSVTVDELRDVVTELRAGVSRGSREAAGRLEALIAAQHPPEPEVPDADWLVGEDRSGRVAFAERLEDQPCVFRVYARAGTFTTSNPLLDLRNLRALDLSALPGPGDEVATLERRVSELRAESARLQEWLSMIEGGDNPSDDAEQLRRWAFQALTLGKRVGDMESKSKGGGDA